MIFSFCFGLCIGSFLNVVIFRMPRRESIVIKRSHCTGCNHLIRWFENIPLVSFVLLRGRCRNCDMRISYLYPAIELIVAIFALLITPLYLNQVVFVSYFFKLSVFAVFVAIFIIDFKHQIIPNELNLYLALVFLLASVLTRPYTYWLFGGLFGLLVPLSITYMFYKLRGKIGLGGGDIKLFGALGIFLGPLGIFLNLSLSCLLGSVVMLALMSLKLARRDSPLPFGPFIVITSFVQIYFPNFFNYLTSFIMRS
jgi:prepilin signal peptidase PulO-like enzyme (type II secretory pathway)